MNIDKKEAGKSLMKALLEKQNLSAEETEERFKKACSADYWRALNPQLKVCSDIPFDDIELNPIETEERAEMLEKLKREGYFAPKQPLIRKEIADSMLLAVENLRKAGWHELFGFVYDEFWQVCRTPSILKLLSSALGEKFHALPHAVVHYVHPETGAGWSPHVDFHDRDNRFTIWFSLSEATIDNGCMYLVAKHRVSEELLEKWIKMKDLSHADAKVLLQATRALPVPAGSVLGWDGDIIHWGTISSPKVNPRVSLSVVYIKENNEPLPDERPLISPSEVPSYAYRMYVIAKAIHFYSIHVLALNKFNDLSKKLLKTYKSSVLS